MSFSLLKYPLMSGYSSQLPHTRLATGAHNGAWHALPAHAVSGRCAGLRVDAGDAHPPTRCTDEQATRKHEQATYQISLFKYHTQSQIQNTCNMPLHILYTSSISPNTLKYR